MIFRDYTKIECFPLAMDKCTDKEHIVLLLRIISSTDVGVNFEALARQWYGNESLGSTLREQYRHICERYGNGVHSLETRAPPSTLTALMDSMLAGDTDPAIAQTGEAAGDTVSNSTFRMASLDSGEQPMSHVPDASVSPPRDTAQESTARWLANFQQDLQQYVRQNESDSRPAGTETSAEARPQHDGSPSMVEGRGRGRPATPHPQKESADRYAPPSGMVASETSSHSHSSASRAYREPSGAMSSVGDTQRICNKELMTEQPTKPIPESASEKHPFDDEGTAEFLRRQQEDREEQERIHLEDEQEEARKRSEEKKLMERIRKIKNQRRMW